LKGCRGLSVTLFNESLPIHVPVPYHAGFDVFLTTAIQPTVRKAGRWFEKLYFVCPRCLHRFAKLYYLLAGSRCASDLLCRNCHTLTYHSQNCSGNKWYREVAVPLKRLYRQREKVLGNRHRPEVQQRLREINRQIRLFEKQVQPQRPNRGFRRSRQKRRYRDLRLLE
jgi:hypothetical protein